MTTELTRETALIESLLLAPWPVLIVDGDGQIVWLNQRLADWLGLPSGSAETLSETDLPDSHWKPLLDPTCPRFEVRSPDQSVRFLSRIRVPLQQQGCEAHFFEDVTDHQRLWQEKELLQDQIRFLETKDAETGLLNRNAVMQALDSQITRSRRYGNPLAIIKLQLVPPDITPRPYLNLRAVTEEINHRLRWADQVGRINPHEFLLVLPESTFADANKLAGRLNDEHIGKAVRSASWALRCEAAEWQRGDDTRQLLQRLNEPYP